MRPAVLACAHLIGVLFAGSPVHAAKCTCDTQCDEGFVCAWDECTPDAMFCAEDLDCGKDETCEQECVLYDYDGERCASTRGTCRSNPEQRELSAECTAFCDKLAPCYDKPAKVKPAVCVTYGEHCKEEAKEPEWVYRDLVLDCKLDCTELTAGEHALAAGYKTLMACVLQDSVTTCREANDQCGSQAEAVFGDEACTGKGFLETRAAGDTSLSPAGNATGCTAGPRPASPLALFVLLGVLVAGRIARSRAVWKSPVGRSGRSWAARESRHPG